MRNVNHAPYLLKREADGFLLFEAAFVKHYAEGYSALFETYPSSNTRVWICRRLDFADRSYGNNLSVLYRNYLDEGSTLVSYMLYLCEVSSEAEATLRVKKEKAGAEFFTSLFSGEE